MHEISLMFELMRQEIGGRTADDDFRKKWNPDLYRELYALSDKHDVAHLTASALSHAGLLGKDEVSEKFRRKLRVAVWREAQRSFALQQMTEVLEREKIPYLPLKGAVLCRYYPETWMRTSCDLDILVRETEAERAVLALCQAGFCRTADNSAHDYSLLSQNQVHVELHYKLSAADTVSDNGLWDSVWEHAKPAEDGGFRYEMSAEYFLLYHLSHMAVHILHGGCGIRPFLDLWLMEQKMPYREKTLRDFLAQSGLCDFYDGVHALSLVWFEGAEPTEQTQLLADYILQGGVYGNTQNSAHIKAAKGQGKVRSFLDLMFLSREELTVIYPTLKKRPYLFGIYQVRRWFRIFRKDKRAKIRHLTATRNRVSDKRVRETQKLLGYLGLVERA